MAQRMFEYVVIHTPPPAAGARPRPVILVPPTTVMADDEKVVVMIAARRIPVPNPNANPPVAGIPDQDLSEVEIQVRPFRSS